MIYSREVEEMCPVAQGVHAWRRSDPGRSKMGSGKGNQGHLRLYTRHRLVCTAAGCM